MVWMNAGLAAVKRSIAGRDLQHYLVIQKPAAFGGLKDLCACRCQGENRS